MPKYCCVPSCSANKRKNPELKYWIIPKDPDRRKQWMEAIGRTMVDDSGKTVLWYPTSTYVFVCERHFITGQKSKFPEHPDYVPSIFGQFTEAQLQRKKRTVKKFELENGISTKEEEKPAKMDSKLVIASRSEFKQPENKPKYKWTGVQIGHPLDQIIFEAKSGENIVQSVLPIMNPPSDESNEQVDKSSFEDYNDSVVPDSNTDTKINVVVDMSSLETPITSSSEYPTMDELMQLIVRFKDYSILTHRILEATDSINDDLEIKYVSLIAEAERIHCKLEPNPLDRPSKDDQHEIEHDLTAPLEINIITGPDMTDKQDDLFDEFGDEDEENFPPSAKKKKQGRATIPTPGRKWKSNLPRKPRKRAEVPEEVLQRYRDKEAKRRAEEDHYNQYKVDDETWGYAYKCNQCEARFKWMCQIKKHLLKHEGRHTTECEICHKHVVRYEKHLEIHSEVDQYWCSKCGEGFKCKANFWKHMNMPNRCPLPAFKCLLCQKTFIKDEQIRLHFENEHFNEKTVCVCGETCSDKCAEEQHYLEMLKPYKCETCNESFSYKKQLKNHKLSNQHAKTLSKYICEYCCQPFATAKLLQRHVGTHTGVWSFKCEECERGFSTRSGLRLHRCVHGSKIVTDSSTKPEIEVEIESTTPDHETNFSTDSVPPLVS